MKVDKKASLLQDFVAKHDPETALLVHKLGLPGESVHDLTTGVGLDTTITYLSLAIVKKIA